MLLSILSFLFLQRDHDVGGAAAGIVILIIWFIVFIGFLLFPLICLWKIFEKAGKPGWHALIPYLNTYTMIELTGRQSWWFILFIIPCTAPIAAFIILIDFAKSYGKEGGFGLGLFFLPFIFFPILAFGNSTYIGKSYIDPRSAENKV